MPHDANHASFVSEMPWIDLSPQCERRRFEGAKEVLETWAEIVMKALPRDVLSA